MNSSDHSRLNMNNAPDDSKITSLRSQPRKAVETASTSKVQIPTIAAQFRKNVAAPVKIPDSLRKKLRHMPREIIHELTTMTPEQLSALNDIEGFGMDGYEARSLTLSLCIENVYENEELPQLLRKVSQEDKIKIIQSKVKENDPIHLKDKDKAFVEYSLLSAIMKDSARFKKITESLYAPLEIDKKLPSAVQTIHNAIVAYDHSSPLLWKGLLNTPYISKALKEAKAQPENQNQMSLDDAIVVLLLYLTKENRTSFPFFVEDENGDRQLSTPYLQKDYVELFIHGAYSTLPLEEQKAKVQELLMRSVLEYKDPAHVKNRFMGNPAMEVARIFNEKKATYIDQLEKKIEEVKTMVVTKEEQEVVTYVESAVKDVLQDVTSQEDKAEVMGNVMDVLSQKIDLESFELKVKIPLERHYEPTVLTQKISHLTQSVGRTLRKMGVWKKGHLSLFLNKLKESGLLPPEDTYGMDLYNRVNQPQGKRHLARGVEIDHKKPETLEEKQARADAQRRAAEKNAADQEALDNSLALQERLMKSRNNMPEGYLEVFDALVSKDRVKDLLSIAFKTRVLDHNSLPEYLRNTTLEEVELWKSTPTDLKKFALNTVGTYKALEQIMKKFDEKIAQEAAPERKTQLVKLKTVINGAYAKIAEQIKMTRGSFAIAIESITTSYVHELIAISKQKAKNSVAGTYGKYQS